MSKKFPSNFESIDDLHNTLHKFEINCVNCNKIMIGPKSKKYCSEACKKEHKYKEKLPELTRVCKKCEKEFIASQKSQEYCSLECKWTRPCIICGTLCNHQKGCKTCSKECAEIKRKRTCVERFGAENALQNPDIKAKQVKTTFERHGIEHAILREDSLIKSKEVLAEKFKDENWVKERSDKIRKTSVERFGYDNCSKSPEIQDKRRKTCIERYGVENPTQSPEIQEKSRKTCLEKYGTENSLASPEVKAKRLKTFMEKYGVAYPMQSKELYKNWENSMLEKYGVSKAKYIHITNFDKYNDKEFILNNFVEGEYFLRDEMAKFFNISESVVNEIKNRLGIKIPNIESFVSTAQRYIFDSIKVDGKILNDRQLIKPLEIDILFEKHKLCVEYNGIFWHSRNIEDMTEEKQQAHYNKMILCENLGYELLQIFETESLEVWISFIKSKLELNQLITNFEIKEVEFSKAFDFINSNSIIPKSNFSKALGAYYNDELVSVISYEINDGVVNIISICDKIDFSVQGFTEKCVKLIKTKYKDSIISFEFDRRFGSYKSFTDIGFKVNNTIHPRKLFVKENFSGITEEQMSDRIIYDCGAIELII